MAVTSYPDTLFLGGSHTVLEGSVVWLYCEVNSIASTLTVIWNRDNVLLVMDVPHITIRRYRNADSTTLILIFDSIETSDNGIYQCMAQDGAETAMGTAITFTGLSL